MNSSRLAFVLIFSSTFCLAAPLDGAALYQRNCAQCHGEHGMGGVVGMGAMTPGTSGKNGGQGMMKGHEGSGMMGLQAPKLVGDASAWKPELFQRAVLEGIDDEGHPLSRVMPHWGSSSFRTDHGKPPTREEIDAIQHYLQAQK